MHAAAAALYRRQRPPRSEDTDLCRLVSAEHRQSLRTGCSDGRKTGIAVRKSCPPSWRVLLGNQSCVLPRETLDFRPRELHKQPQPLTGKPRRAVLVDHRFPASLTKAETNYVLAMPLYRRSLARVNVGVES